MYEWRNKTKMNAKKRIDWVDVAKGIGMICVILSHVEEENFSNPYLKMPLYTFHMPLFFFLSGYLFSMKSSFKEFLVKKCQRILVPYFTLGGILILFDIYWHGRNPFHESWFNKKYAMSDLMQFLTQKRYLTLWFIACLFWLSILFYVLVRFVEKEVVRAVIVIVLTIAAMFYYRFGGTSLYWNIDVCFTALPFFYVGFLCRKTDIINKVLLESNRKILWFIGFVAIDVLCAIGNQMLTGEFLEMFWNHYAFPPFTYLGAFAGIFAVILLANVCNCFPLRYIGANTMLFYAWHQTMMIPLVTEFYKKMDLFQSHFFPLWVRFVRVGITTVLICLVLGIVNELLCRLKLGFLMGK